MRIETCERFSQMLAYLVFDVLRIRRDVVEENLRYAFPEKTQAQREKLARGMWRHLCLLVFELAHMHRKIHRSNWRDYIQFESSEVEKAFFIDPRPVILLSGHFGNFEVGGVVTGLMGIPTYTVARPLDNPYLHDFITRFRESTGQYMLPKSGSSKVADEILKAGGRLALLGDQSAGPKGCWVDFFGRPTSSHKAVALFSLTYRAPMLLCYARRAGRGMRFQLGTAGYYDPQQHGPCDVPQLTRWYNGCLEDLVRSAPDQYWWVHRRWKGRPDESRRRKRRSAAVRRTEPDPDTRAA